MIVEGMYPGTRPIGESDPLFGHFTRHEGIFGHNPGRPVLCAHYTCGVMTECRHPRGSRGRRRRNHWALESERNHPLGM